MKHHLGGRQCFCTASQSLATFRKLRKSLLLKLTMSDHVVEWRYSSEVNNPVLWKQSAVSFVSALLSTSKLQ